MSKKKISFSAFSLAKGKELVGDDFYGVKLFDDLLVAIVCDGVGSAKEGATAAKKVVKHIMQNFKNRPLSWSIEKSIKKFISSINAILYQESMANYESVELLSTLAMVVIKGNRLYGANVGDSRVYLLREEELVQLSLDHIEEGFDGVLNKAIGLEKEVDPYYFENNLEKNDKILLCSDGLYNVLNKSELKKALPLGASALVKRASRKCNDDLPDDTTAIVIDILQKDETTLLKELNLPIPKKLKKAQIIDGYKLIRPLIGNERTWEAHKKGKRYVLKFPILEAMESEWHLDAFINEAWNAKRLKAGFFAKTVIPKKRSYRYYVQEFIEGSNLKEYIKKHPLHIDDAITLAKTLLKASQYLLKFDLVHADIKPENIIVTKRGEKLIFKLIDFGSMTPIYSTASRVGTPSYLAPERFSQSAISESSEIFAIGVTLYEALTKKLPYGEIEPFSTPKFSKAKMPHLLNSKIPIWLSSIIMRAIEIEPKKRYQNYSEMLYELEHPSKVKPYIDLSRPLIEREPLKAYKIGFVLSFIINLILLVLFLQK